MERGGETVADQGREEYIESELAKRHAAEARAAAVASGTLPIEDTASSLVGAQGKPAAQPAMQGKLMEIDLGDESRQRNEAATERARRRALGEAVDEHEATSAGSSRPRKVRLGRDGKPWRGRNRRNSEDIKRDQLVDQFLKENRREFPPPPLLPLFSLHLSHLTNVLQLTSTICHPNRRPLPDLVSVVTGKAQTRRSRRTSGGSSWMR